MDEFINSGMVSMTIIIGLIMGVSQCIKLYINAKWIPIINIILGITFCLFFATDYNIQLRILNGIITGLSAGGLYSSQKNIRQGFKGDE